MVMDLLYKSISTKDGDIRIPTVAFHLTTMDGKTLEKALTCGYRHIICDGRPEHAVILRRVLQKWRDSGKIRREDMFVSITLNTSSPSDAITKTVQNIKTESKLEYFDLVILNKDQKTDLRTPDTLTRWQHIEKLQSSGSCKCVGVSNCSQAELGWLHRVAQIPPSVYMVTPPCQNGTSSTEIAALRSFCLYNKITLFTSLKPSSLTDVSKITTRKLGNISKQYHKSPLQILGRVLIQRGCCVVYSGSDFQDIDNLFKVYDFMVDSEDAVAVWSGL